jgi:hypothetical protein
MAAAWLTDQITTAIATIATAVAPATGACAECLPRSGSTTTQEGSQ